VRSTVDLLRPIAACVLAASLACASWAPSQRTVLAGNWARTLVLLPLNVPAVMPTELEAAGPRVSAELENYLLAQGKELKTVAFPTARQLWMGAIRSVRAAEGAGAGDRGGRAGFDDAARAFVLELARHAEFDGVVIPSLFVRHASIEGQSARWDGVERPVEFELAGGTADAAPPEVEGVALAASLHAAVFDAQGNKLQEGLRGLDLLMRVRVSEPTWSPDGPRSFEYETYADPLARPEHVRAGIADALAPFLPRRVETP
jgi:hypothetical protein